ncbi:MAG: hypothetical protein ACE5JB_05865, partial [bacterium]
RVMGDYGDSITYKILNVMCKGENGEETEGIRLENLPKSRSGMARALFEEEKQGDHRHSHRSE